MSKKSYIFLGIGFWLFTIIFVAAPIWPYVYYRLSPGTSEVLAAGIADTALQPGRSDLEGPVLQKGQILQEASLPPFDPSLPEENGLIIKKIGVRGQIHEGDNWQEILKEGVWRVPNFGTPDNNQLPIILAAHRFGYVNWTNSFRTLNSFFNLPKLKVGDQIEVVWDQRKYVYEIYKEETGAKITDYAANLILYTCELWNSPTRIFRYAKRTG